MGSYSSSSGSDPWKSSGSSFVSGSSSFGGNKGWNAGYAGQQAKSYIKINKANTPSTAIKVSGSGHTGGGMYKGNFRGYFDSENFM